MNSRTAMAIVAVGLALALAGCGGMEGAGSTAGPDLYSGPLPAIRTGRILYPTSVLEALAADLEAAGKPMPEFLTADEEVTPQVVGGDEISPLAYMTVLSLGRWLTGGRAVAGRTQWYEFSLTTGHGLCDVLLHPQSGDPDLYVFTPLRPDPRDPSLRMIGYSVGHGYDQVGSFRARDWGGPGRYVVAVYGYSTGSFDLLAW